MADEIVTYPENEPTYSRYEHHGTMVYVRTDLKGRHRDYSLCYRCQAFVPDGVNCPIAEIIHDLNKSFGVITPMWECGGFKERI